ncbi:hypothetical protein ETAE_3291 [Edwardsiella piscicida]|uniref:Uncharacterized protein n=1 Tax=Edwardsiella piscicida TaxID=1263550 RepID=A0AAU8P6P8_EDWPI|nr:hypothetical protein ETAE_3291 [Edwardsiella tarda EIB202]
MDGRSFSRTVRRHIFISMIINIYLHVCGHGAAAQGKGLLRRASPALSSLRYCNQN